MACVQIRESNKLHLYKLEKLSKHCQLNCDLEFYKILFKAKQRVNARRKLRDGDR